MNRARSMPRSIDRIVVFVTALGIASAALLAQNTAHAAGHEAQTTPDEITVFARKRSETVKDVPATVAVFTQDAIERSDIDTASDIALLTPGVSLVDAAEQGDTQVNIRGMNGARDAENNYALVIDGITYTNPAALNRQYAFLQQIEVLKGPQGAIYGRNASAGAFIITTREPGEELEGQFELSVGQDTTYSLLGAVGGRLNSFMRGSVQAEYYTTDGFYTNEFLNRDDITDDKEIRSATGRLIFDLGDNTTIDTKLRVGEVEGSSITFNSVFHVPGFVGLLGPAVYEDVNDHPIRFFNNVIHTNEQDSLEFSAKLETSMSWADLTLWGLYSDIENELGADGTSAAFGFFFSDPTCVSTTGALAGFPINPPQFVGADPASSVFGAYTPTTCDGTQFQRRNQEDYSFELRLTSNGDGPLQWMGGLYYLNIEREVAVATGLDNLAAGSGFRGGTVIQTPFTTDPSNPTDQLVWDRFDTDVYSIFGQVSYDFSDTVTGDVALRYDREEREVTNLVPTVADGATATFINPCTPGVAPGPTTPINPGLCADPFSPIPSQERNFSELQPKVSLKWDVADNWTLFTSLGVGFRSGGFNNQGSEATVNTFINDRLFNAADLGGVPTGLCDPSVAGCVETGRSRVGITDSYEEETSTAFELGFKSDFLDGRVRLEGAGYYTEVDDMQFFEFVVGPFGLLRVVENIDEVEILGVELGVTWEAASWLDLYLAGNYNDTEIKENSVRPDTVGNDSPYTPEYTWNTGAYLNLPITEDTDFFANLDISTIGPTWFHVVQNQTRPIGFEVDFGVGGPFTPGEYSVTERDRYTLANLRLGVETDVVTAAIYVDNLFDEDYLEEIIPAPEFGGSFIHPGTERRAGVDLTVRF